MQHSADRSHTTKRPLAASTAALCLSEPIPTKSRTTTVDCRRQFLRLQSNFFAVTPFLKMVAIHQSFYFAFPSKVVDCGVALSPHRWRVAFNCTAPCENQSKCTNLDSPTALSFFVALCLDRPERKPFSKSKRPPRCPRSLRRTPKGKESSRHPCAFC